MAGRGRSLVARSLDPVRCDVGLTVIPTDTPESLRDPDLIVVPGSGNPVPVLSDQVLIDWLRTAAPNCQWTASVCTGAGLYAAAGLLEGKKTTTHWGFRDNLRAMGVAVVGDRVVWQGNHISGAGVSAGIDMALALTERVHGRELAESLQLVIEYDPEPPFDRARPTRPTPARCASPCECCSATGHSRWRRGSTGRAPWRGSAGLGARSPDDERTGKHPPLDLPSARQLAAPGLVAC